MNRRELLASPLLLLVPNQSRMEWGTKGLEPAQPLPASHIRIRPIMLADQAAEDTRIANMVRRRYIALLTHERDPQQPKDYAPLPLGDVVAELEYILGISNVSKTVVYPLPVPPAMP